MKALFIDTHFKDIHIALLENGKLVHKCEVINQKNNSEFIFAAIIEVIDGIKLDEIVVVTGPGSFTGVRLGVTIAKTFAYCLNIPIKTVSSLECYAISSSCFNVGLFDGNGYYIGYFDDDFHLQEDYFYVDKDEFINIEKIVSLDNYFNYEKIYNFVKSNKLSENPHLIKPIYVKKIGVEKWLG